MKPECFVPDCEKCPFKWSCKTWTKPTDMNAPSVWATPINDPTISTETICTSGDWVTVSDANYDIYTPEDWVDVYDVTH